MIKIGLSTSSVYPLGLEEAFRLAKKVGYDGVEVMVTQNSSTRDTHSLIQLSKKYGMEILSIHAPVLLLTHFVWGKDPEHKLWKSAYLAKSVNAPTVVVHPPFNWQNGYSKNFLSIVETIQHETGVEIAVENMFPWKLKNREVAAYSPSWEIIEEQAKAITIDFSHAALTGENSLDMVKRIGERVRHIHLCDGTGPVTDEKDKIFDEHLLPGQGNQPVAETLQLLKKEGWGGSIVAEINTRKVRGETNRVKLLTDTLNFARIHTA